MHYNKKTKLDYFLAEYVGLNTWSRYLNSKVKIRRFIRNLQMRFCKIEKIDKEYIFRKIDTLPLHQRYCRSSGRTVYSEDLLTCGMPYLTTKACRAHVNMKKGIATKEEEIYFAKYKDYGRDRWLWGCKYCMKGYAENMVEYVSLPEYKNWLVKGESK